MWHFGKYGFISAVAYDPKKDDNKKSLFRSIAKNKYTHVLVRARVKEDLEDLLRVVKKLHIEEDVTADYSWRAVVTRRKFKEFMCLHVDDIDYDSHFKEVVRDNATQPTARYGAMMSCWTAMARLQRTSPYGYGHNSSYSWSGSSSATSSGSTTYPSYGSSSSAAPAKSTSEYVNDYLEERGYKVPKEAPPHTFETGDKVMGYAGEGVVLSVKKRVKDDSADLLEIRWKDGKSGMFLSTFVRPLAPKKPKGKQLEIDIPDNAPALTDEEQGGRAAMDDRLSIDDVYDSMLIKGEASFPSDEVSLMDDEAFELYVQVQEKHGTGAKVDQIVLDEVYEEIVLFPRSDGTQTQG